MANLPTQNNNPGDLKYANQPDASSSSSGFADFSSPQAGYGALLNQVQSYITKDPNYTLGDFANKWAPPSDNNNIAQYTANLANQLGVSPDTTIGTLEPQIGKFADAIAKNEGYNGTTDSSVNQNTSNEPSLWDSVLGGLGGLASGATSYASSHLGALGGIALGAGTVGAGILGATETGGASLLAVPGGLAEIAGGAGGLGGSSGSNSNASAGSTESSGTPPTDDSSVISSLLGQNMVKATKQSDALAQTHLQNLSATPTGSVLTQNPNYVNGANTLGMFGIAGQTLKNGRTDNAQAIQQVKELTKGLDSDISSNEKESGAQGNYENTIKSAKESNHKYLPETQWADADAEVDKAALVYQMHDKANGGNGITASTHRFHEIKKQEGKGRKFDPTESNAKRKAHEHFSTAAKNEVLKNSKNPEHYRAALKMEQNLIHGKKILEKTNGKRAPKNESLKKTFLKAGGSAAAAYLGNMIGGPAGAIISYMIETNVARAVDKKYGSTIFTTPEMKKNIAALKGKNPEAYAILKAQLHKNGIKFEEDAKKAKEQQANLPRLGAGAILMGQGKDDSGVVEHTAETLPKSSEQMNSGQKTLPESKTIFAEAPPIGGHIKFKDSKSGSAPMSAINAQFTVPINRQNAEDAAEDIVSDPKPKVNKKNLTIKLHNGKIYKFPNPKSLQDFIDEAGL